MVSTQLRILRVFGLTSAEVTSILRAAQDDGCPGLRLLERDGEFAVCVQASAPTQAMADEHCDKWAQKLRARFGDAFYGMGEISLAQAALDALVKKRRLIVAADETTGRLLGNLLQPLDHSEAVFDFGTQTYANAAAARRITTPQALMKKFPGDVLQAAAGRAQAALQVGQADYAAMYMPATVGQAPFVLLCDKRGAVACAVTPEMSDAAIGNNILDLARRRALGLKFSQGTIQFRPGHERPLLLVSQAGQQKPGDTTRFSLRRRSRSNTGTKADFEPMLDFDTAQIPKAAKMAAAAAVGASAARAASKAASKRPTPDNAASVAASAWAAAEQDWNDTADRAEPVMAGARTAAPTGTITFETPTDIDASVPRPRASALAQTPGDEGETPLTFTTGGAQNAAAYRAARAGQTRSAGTARPAPSQATGTVQIPTGVTGAGQDASRTRQHSILDDDIPDFTASLDPETIRAAQQADDAQEPRSLEDFQAAAKQLYDSGSPDDVLDPAKNRSLAAIERAERKQRRTMTVVFVLFLVLILAGAVGLWYYFSNHIGSKPSPKGYGTAQFDESAGEYLASAQQKKENVVGYLAFPGWEGQLVYTTGATSEDAIEARPQIQGTSYLGSASASNTVLDLDSVSIADITSLETMRDNAGFTLYLADGTYRYKVMAVYYQDPAEDGGFDPAGYSDLSSYSDYLSFVLGAHMHSLYDTDIDVEDGSKFLTLVAASDVDGINLCVTGRLIEEGENAQLAAAPIKMQENPLLTAAQYAASGQEMPDTAFLLQAQLEWYAGVSTIRTATASGEEDGAEGSETVAPNQEGQPGQDTSSVDLGQSIEDLQNQTDNLITSADKLLAGLTDKAGEAGASESDLNQGAEGSLPEQEVPIDSITGGNSGGSSDSSSSSSDSSTGGDSSSSDGGSSSSGGDSSGSGGGGSTEGETINVTMNGTQQTMDLVTCLAMIAQNELGPNAPAEAYKAQCVAAHCWILSQGGYPSVAGTTPGAAATAAAQEVAHVLITYNGNVCFTPYFASASKGTASSADVWGGERAWLQAVESPYDETTATNWHTNGATSGTARFSRATVQQRILDVLGIDLSGVDPNKWFKILSTNQYGWVTKMQIGPDEGPNTTCRGTWFRETLLARQSVDGRSLRSQCFTVSYDSNTDCFIFDVYGYGHGCGMSQWGAVGYAQNGWSYQDILLHYYPGTTLTTY